MSTFALKTKPVVKEIEQPVWTKLPEGHWQSGTVQLREIRHCFTGDYRHEQWGVFLKIRGKWTQCHAPSRPWLYGSPGQAKRGVPKVAEFVVGNPEI